jgi:chromosome partitioning protein
LFKLIQVVRGRTNPLLSYRILVTMYDQRGSLHKHLLERIYRHYRPALLDAIIGFDSKVRESQLSGEPVTTFAPRCRAAQQYRSLAQELQGYVQRQILQPA